MRHLILAIAMLSILTACGGTSTAPPAATAEPKKSERRTGIEGVDSVVDAVVSGDLEMLRRLLRFTSISCEVNPLGIGAPPGCRLGEADGTPVDALPMAQCEGFYVRADEIDTTLESLTSGDASLYAVYLEAPGSWPPGDYVAVLSRNSPTLGEVGQQLVIADGRLVGVVESCGLTPEQMVESGYFDGVVLPPP